VLVINNAGGDRGTCPSPARCRPPVRASETETKTTTSSSRGDKEGVSWVGPVLGCSTG
jgi:hypothetical protein